MRLKKLLKNSDLAHKILVNMLFLYLKIAYYTSKWEFIWPDGWDKKQLKNLDGALFVFWHNRLAFGMHIFQGIDNTYALASPHTDGRIITDIIRKMGFGVIEGSTNRNPAGALKNIIAKINSGNNVVITPDGPRGPVYEVNSAVCKIAKKFDKPLIPLSCRTNRYYELNSWDKMIIPKFFSKIRVYFGEPLDLTDNDETNDKLLESTLQNIIK